MSLFFYSEKVILVEFAPVALRFTPTEAMAWCLVAVREARSRRLAAPLPGKRPSGKLRSRRLGTFWRQGRQVGNRESASYKAFDIPYVASLVKSGK